MRVLFDLNVLLDLVLRRPPFYEVMSELVAFIEDKVIVGMIGATTLVSLAHLTDRALGLERATNATERLLSQFEIRSIGRAALEEALTVAPGEYDDAVLYAAARQGRADAIVTRNPENFQPVSLSIYTPEQLLDRLRTDAVGELRAH